MAKAKMGASHGWCGNYVESATASFSLVPGDAGKTFILKDAAVTVTLPALSDVEAGYSITLISGDDSEHILTGGSWGLLVAPLAAPGGPWRLLVAPLLLNGSASIVFSALCCSTARRP